MDEIPNFAFRHRPVRPRRLALAVLTLAACLWGGLPACAHATLESATPEPDARLAESPPWLELVFSERIDAKGAVLRVLAPDGRTAADGPAEPFAGGRGVRIPLPDLGDGVYTVSYRIVSADGHPVSGAYVFTVGQPPDRPAAGGFDPGRAPGPVHDHNPGLRSGRMVDTLLHYAARWFYFAGLLAAAGMALWSWHRDAPGAVREARETGLRLAGQFLLLAAAGYVFFHLRAIAPEEPAREWLRLLAETTAGKLYATTLALALVAPLLTSCGPALRTGWAAAAMLAEAWSGHAAAYDPPVAAVALDVLHLVAGALWSGGLLLLLAAWRRDREAAGRFAVLFSRWALAAFVALWLSGSILALLFVRSPEDIGLTAWGGWLLAKAGLAAAVAVVAFFLRRRLLRGRTSVAGWLGVDAGLFAALALCAAVLTHLNPVPAHVPLNVHQMGEDLHFTLRIAPNAPGTNTFTVIVWLPERVDGGRPKRVQLRLKPDDRTDGYIEVPLAPFDVEVPDTYTGFVRSAYRAEGPYLSLRGWWTAQIRVTDGADTEHVREMAFPVR